MAGKAHGCFIVPLTKTNFLNIKCLVWEVNVYSRAGLGFWA